MIHAYDKVLLDRAADTLGRMLDYSVYSLHYDVAAIMPWKDIILRIITKRQLDACEDWKAFGQELSGKTIDDFAIDRYFDELTEPQAAEA